MNRFRTRGFAMLGASLLTGVMVGVVPASSASAAPRALVRAGTPFTQAGFVSYGTGSELELKALHTGTTTLADVDQAFSGETAAGGGVGTAAVVSPITGAVIQPAGIATGANATARGSGLEVGLGLSQAQADQIQAGIAESHSPPPAHDGTLAGPDVSAIPLQIPNLLQTGVLHGFTATNFSPNFCPVGQPISFGLGSAAAPTTVLNNTVASPGAAASSTQTALVANTDGTFGLTTRVQETIAPLVVNLPGTITITITVQGTGPSTPISLTAFTDGEGHSSVAVGNGDPTVTVTISIAGVPLPNITASLSGLAALINPLLAPGGSLATALSGAGLTLNLSIGDGHTVASPIPTFTNGSNAISGSYDLIGLKAALGSTTLADLRLGHMEAAAALPTGSIACTVPVAKAANPTTVTAGGSFVWSISIPSSADALADSSCDLVNIKATDKISVNSGSPTFTVGSISNGGVFNASNGTITWNNLGTYHPGDPPIVLTVNVSVSGSSAAGVLQDTANVTAGLGNCTGGITGTTTLIGPNLGNVVVSGNITLVAPRITGSGVLPITGEGPALPWIAAGLVLMAVATRRVVRKVRRSS